MDVRPWGSMSSIIAHSFIRSLAFVPVFDAVYDGSRVEGKGNHAVDKA